MTGKNQQKLKKTNQNAREVNRKINPTDMAQDDFLLSITESHEKFMDSLGVTYVRLEKEGHKEIHEVQSREYYAYLLDKLHSHYKKPNSKAARKVMDIVNTQAICSKTEYKLYTRVAKIGDEIFVDLCNDDWEVVKISKKGWKITTNYPIVFKRTSIMAKQVTPTRGGDIYKLFQYMNIEKRYKLLLLTQIIAMFLANIPHNILAFWGPAGRGKTFLSRTIKSLVDPSKSDILAIPSTEEDFILSLSSAWVPVYDNVSYLSRNFSDILCRASTGGAYNKRTKYTDKGITLFELEQCVIFNGIPQLATQPDLISRITLYKAQKLPASKRKTSEEFWQGFNADKPEILGCIFDILSKTLRNGKKVTIQSDQRLLDSVIWCFNIAENMGGQGAEFLKQFEEKEAYKNKHLLITHPVGNAVKRFINREKSWTGTASQLYSELCSVANKDELKHELWPKAANALKVRLDEIDENLHKAGVVYKHKGHRLKGSMIEIALKEHEKDTQNEN